MSTRTKQKLARDTLRSLDALLVTWQEAFGRGDCDPRDCSPIIDAILDARTITSEWSETEATVKV